MKRIRERIIQRMNELDLSYSELSDLSGLSKTSIHRWATGGSEKIAINHIERLSKALQVSPSWLVGWEEWKEK